jgi:hypothetical protein
MDACSFFNAGRSNFQTNLKPEQPASRNNLIIAIQYNQCCWYIHTHIMCADCEKDISREERCNVIGALMAVAFFPDAIRKEIIFSSKSFLSFFLLSRTLYIGLMKNMAPIFLPSETNKLEKILLLSLMVIKTRCEKKKRKRDMPVMRGRRKYLLPGN